MLLQLTSALGTTITFFIKIGFAILNKSIKHLITPLKGFMKQLVFQIYTEDNFSSDGKLYRN